MKNKIKIYTASCLALTAILSVIRYLALTAFYDTQTGYFNASFLTSAMNALYVLCVLWCLSELVFIPKAKIKTEFTASSLATKPVSAFAAALFLLSALYTFTNLSHSKVQSIGALFVAMSTLFFIFSLSGGEVFKTAKAFASIALTIALIFTLAALYFDMTVAMNSPNKILGIFAIMASMIFMLCETRTYLDTPFPRLHFASALLTVVFGVSLVISAVLYILIGHPTAFVTNPIVLGNIGHIAVIAGISAYAAARCFTFNSISEEIENKAE